MITNILIASLCRLTLRVVGLLNQRRICRMPSAGVVQGTARTGKKLAARDSKPWNSPARIGRVAAGEIRTQASSN